MGKKSSLKICSLTDFPNLLSAYVHINRFSYSRVSSDLGISTSTAMLVLRTSEPFARKQSAITAMYTKYPELTPAAWSEWLTVLNSTNTQSNKELLLLKILDDIGLSSIVPSQLVPGNAYMPGICEAMHTTGGVLKLPLTVLERNLLDALSTKVGVSRADLIRKCLDQLAQQHPDALESAFKMASYEVSGKVPREGKGIKTNIQISKKARDLISLAFPNTDPVIPPAQVSEDIWESSSVATLSYVDIFEDSEND